MSTALYRDVCSVPLSVYLHRRSSRRECYADCCVSVQTTFSHKEKTPIKVNKYFLIEETIDLRFKISCTRIG